MRAAALLLLGLGAGFLLGYSARPDARAARAARPEGRGDPAPPPVRRAAEGVAAQAAGPAVEAGPAAEAVPPPEREGVGWLEIDCRGGDVPVTDVEVRGRSMSGEVTEMPPSSEDDDVARFELWAGDYVAEWWDPEPRRVGVRVRAGEVARLSVAAPRAPGEDPIALGLGRLLVSALDLEGRPIPGVDVHVFGPGRGGIQEDEVYAEENGTARADVLPGPYRLVIGDQERQARVRAGEETAVVFRYQGEGEVDVRVPLPGAAFLHRAGAPMDGYGHAGGSLFRYLRPGLYDVMFRGSHETGEARSLGRVEVRAGRRTTLEPELPPGGIRVRLTGAGAPSWPGDEPVSLRRLDPGAPGGASLYASYTFDGDVARFPGEAQFLWLPAGRWRIEYASKRFRPVQRDVAVGDSVVEIELRLEPER